MLLSLSPLLSGNSPTDNNNIFLAISLSYRHRSVETGHNSEVVKMKMVSKWVRSTSAESAKQSNHRKKKQFQIGHVNPIEVSHCVTLFSHHSHLCHCSWLPPYVIMILYRHRVRLLSAMGGGGGELWIF